MGAHFQYQIVVTRRKKLFEKEPSFMKSGKRGERRQALGLGIFKK